jgi:tRNA dimethylallyltransferase
LGELLEQNNIPLLVIAGPTASGKTALAVKLALQRGGEVVSADSMQVYRGMDIATAKPSAEELAAVPHHLIGFADPGERFSVAQYAPLARAAIADIHRRGKLPILCGGTGLYLQAVTEHLVLPEAACNPAYRAALEARDTPALYQELLTADPHTKTNPNDRKRILRALELYVSTGLTIAEQNEISRRLPSPYAARMIFLNPGDRQALYQRIDARVDEMFARGLLEEARQWRQTKAETAAQAIGYKELEPYFQGARTLEEAAQGLKRATRRYAKRQLSWFRRMAAEWNAREPGSCRELFGEPQSGEAAF